MGPGSNPSRFKPLSSWRTSSPEMPGTRSLYAGLCPWSAKRGRPDAVRSTSPSFTWALGEGSFVITPALGFKAEGTITIGCGDPKRAVPRVMTSELNTRRSTGTRIGDGVGGAVRAATSAGDSIREPATQPPTAAAAISARTQNRTAIGLLIVNNKLPAYVS